jgi:hypothetical protein
MAKDGALLAYLRWMLPWLGGDSALDEGREPDHDRQNRHQSTRRAPNCLEALSKRVSYWRRWRTRRLVMPG